MTMNNCHGFFLFFFKYNMLQMRSTKNKNIEHKPVSETNTIIDPNNI